MKKTSMFIALASLLLLASCNLFELDSYPAPAETLHGEVVDVATGKRVLTDQGSEGIRVRLIETSWGENVTPNPDFFCMPDGTFQHTKIFKGTYNVQIDGPFIPLLREDERGVPIADETKDLDIEGVTEAKFEVQPFLNVEWVGEPQVVNGKIQAKVRVSRGVTENEFREKIEPMGGYSSSFQNVTDIQLFVSYSSSVGYRARDERWTSALDYTGSSFNSLLGQTVTIESNGTIPPGRIVFIRAAARINYDTPVGSGTRRYNYTDAKEVFVN
ncbi:DUF3823 domain-containing protein [Sphingobacterium bambusae]|uniref:DUF3823 domain-containing protein n=1 Tax=Sphingobacterium bambusae TaxID=662858 RepID=A0ABW6BQJ8_9SPHI|nr:DUF3823 domain-containing protein [Sphingobacterium bambusae]WPL47931.1 DUF3823 domain-containing protein [Sphingobacterium bambusae]